MAADWWPGFANYSTCFARKKNYFQNVGGDGLGRVGRAGFYQASLSGFKINALKVFSFFVLHTEWLTLFM